MTSTMPVAAPRSPRATWPPNWDRNDPNLATAWALDHSVTTAETAARRRRCLDGEFAKIDEEWSLSDCSANAGRGKAAARAPKATSVVSAVALRTAQQEAERLLHERQAAAGQGCRGPPAPYHRWRGHDDDGSTDGDSGAAGQGGRAYEVIVRYRV